MAPTGESLTIGAAEFAEGLRQVVPAASTDDSRPILTGVLLAREGTGLRLVSTDSYRLAVRDLPGTSVLAGLQYSGQIAADALRRVKLMAREATPVRLTMSADGLELVAITQDVGQAHEQLDAQYEGTDLTVAFNPDYLMNGLDVTPGDEVSIETVDTLKPALLRSLETTDFLYLLMPVRVS